MRRARRDKSGRITHRAVWLIRDGRYRQGTGCGVDDREQAEQALADYIARKRIAKASAGQRAPAQIPIADVLSIYLRDVAPKHARPHETGQRAKALLAFFGTKTLAEINGHLCRSYAARRSTDAAARRELEDLRAAINHHRREGFCREVVDIVLPNDCDVNFCCDCQVVRAALENVLIDAGLTNADVRRLP